MATPIASAQIAQALQQTGGPAAPSQPLAAQIETFESALRTAQDTTGTQSAQVHLAQFAPVEAPQVPLGATGIGPAQAPAPAQEAQLADMDARQRALEGLELGVGPVGGTSGAGQSILDGLSRLRGMFDGQLADMSRGVEGAGMDVVAMMDLQAEVVKYSLMVDVGSKLAGKSTQAIDTLMKGQ